jgi:beta-lactamase superfamily II metal-dependent hydrolase
VIIMDYEIEFHAVGDGTKAGDAISVRYGSNGVYEVMVIDGGTQDSGAELVEHIKQHYGANCTIAHVVSSHPDTDHASGLRQIFENFTVHNLWIHGLWHHTDSMLPYFAPGISSAALSNAIREQYPIIEELIDQANAHGTSIYEPFTGAAIGPFIVLSPTLHAYERLVPQFRKTPVANQPALEAESWWLGVQKQSALASIFEKVAAAVSKWIPEIWDVELLREGSVTAAENETSTVLYGQFGDTGILLTADAGVNALTWACDRADALGINLQATTVTQMPHHGSRSNVTPSILNRLLGPKLPAGSALSRLAVVSCPKDDEQHPRKMVVNAFRRRGLNVHKTQGFYFRHHSTAFPPRPTEIAAQPFGWFDSVEDYD